MKSVDQTKLSEHVCKSADLLPLLLFRGTKKESIRSNWNFAYAMFLAEAESIRDGVVLSQTGETLHFCGSHAKCKDHGGIRSFFSRLRLCPEVTRQIPGLTDYARLIVARPFHLTPVSQVAINPSHPEDIAPWRTIQWITKKRKPRVWRASAEPMNYPFCRHAHDDASLVSKVHALVPRGIPQEIRGDLCQDLLVGVLSGDLTIDNVPDAIARYLRSARKFMPDQPRHVSFDAALGGDDERTLHDVYSEHRHG